MHVLVTEQLAGESTVIQRDLAAAGFQVSACHSGVGPCLALTPGRWCPLDNQARPVDVLVAVRSSGSNRLTAREFGVVCALRAGVPAVVTSLHPRPAPTPPEHLEQVVTRARRGHLARVCRQLTRRDRSTPDRPVIPWPQPWRRQPAPAAAGAARRTAR